MATWHYYNENGEKISPVRAGKSGNSLSRVSLHRKLGLRARMECLSKPNASDEIVPLD